MAQSKKLIFILGMHRSGTSLLARICNILGVELGENLMLPAADNPAGFWENKSVVNLNDRLLGYLGHSWDDGRKLPENWLRNPRMLGAADEAVELLRSEFPSATLAGLKDPRLCRLLPFWIKVAERAGFDCRFLHVTRNVIEVADSLQRRNGFTPGKSAMLWLRHVLEAEHASRDKPRAFVTYEELLDDWQKPLQSAWKSMQLRWTTPSKAQVRDIEAHLAKDMKHFSAATEDVMNDFRLAPLAGKIQEILDKHAGGGVAELSTRFNELSDLLSSMEYLFDPMLDELSQRYTALRNTSNEYYLETEKKVRSLQEDLIDKENRLAALQSKFSELERNSEAEISRLLNETSVLQNQVQEIYESNSWKVTRPLRALTSALREFRNSTLSRLGNRTRHFLRRTYYWLPLPEKFKRTARNILVKIFGRWLGTTPDEGLGVGPYTELVNRSALSFTDPNETDPESLPKLDFEGVCEAQRPLVSVIIPVHNKWAYTRLCLASVIAHPPAASFEVVVVDDCSSDETAEHLDRIPGISVVTNDKNLGFIGACNRGAALAKGEYLCFLNNDTLVLPGWLDALLDVFESNEAAGVAGSKLVFANHLLQEAGGIVWRDGSAWNYGRMGDPDAPQFNYLREADYVSAACMVTPTGLWKEIGGFDDHYAPAYYEDTDYCFQVRDKGRRVFYQPLSTVIHHEGVTSGTDESSSVKKFQATNMRKFRERWKKRLARHRVNAESPELEKERSVTKRILVIDAEVLTPDKDAGSLVNFNYLRIFQRLGYKPTFVPDNLQFHNRYTRNLQAIGVECIYYPFYGSVTEYLKENLEKFDAVFISRPYIAAQHIDTIRSINPEIPIVYNSCDLHFFRERRQAELENSEWLRRRARQTKKQELDVIRKSDRVIVVSPVEKELLASEAPTADVNLIQLIVDEEPPGPPFEKRKDILFIGGYRHPPNVDAVNYFVREVMPAVRERLPDLRLHVLGSNPPAELLDLANDSVQVTGWLEDISEYFYSCIAMVVPLRYGAGVKGKIGTAFSYGLPVISSKIGAEGLQVTDGEDIVIAESVDEWVEAIAMLHEDAGFWSRLSENGRKIVRERYSLEVVEKQVEALLTSLDKPPHEEKVSNITSL